MRSIFFKRKKIGEILFRDILKGKNLYKKTYVLKEFFN